LDNIDPMLNRPSHSFLRMNLILNFFIFGTCAFEFSGDAASGISPTRLSAIGCAGSNSIAACRPHIDHRHLYYRAMNLEFEAPASTPSIRLNSDPAAQACEPLLRRLLPATNDTFFAIDKVSLIIDFLEGSEGKRSRSSATG
jgi:hypothetical protein